MKLKKIINFVKEKVIQGFTVSGIPLLIMFLGALGGSDGTSKGIRRLGIPVIFIIISWITYSELWILFLVLLILPLSLGHGIPCNIKGHEDEGSTLGKYFYEKFKNKTKANIATRGTKGLLICLIFSVVPFQTGNMLSYLLGCGLILFGYTTVSWRALGNIKKTFKEVEYTFQKSDLINYGLLGIGGTLIITGGF